MLGGQREPTAEELFAHGTWLCTKCKTPNGTDQPSCLWCGGDQRQREDAMALKPTPPPDATDLADIAELIDVYGRFWSGLIGPPESRQIAAAQLTLAFVLLRQCPTFPTTSGTR